MTEKIEDATRKQVALFLPAAIARATSSYNAFMQQTADLKAKEFSEHHKAGKVAISHLELLLKLARWADLPSGEDADQSALIAMLNAAEENLENHKQHFSESEESDEDLA